MPIDEETTVGRHFVFKRVKQQIFVDDERIKVGVFARDAAALLGYGVDGEVFETGAAGELFAVAGFANAWRAGDYDVGLRAHCAEGQRQEM